MNSYLRSMMGQARLKSISVLNIERPYSIDCISKNMDQVIDLFGFRHGRQHFFFSLMQCMLLKIVLHNQVKLKQHIVRDGFVFSSILFLHNIDDLTYSKCHLVNYIILFNCFLTFKITYAPAGRGPSYRGMQRMVSAAYLVAWGHCKNQQKPVVRPCSWGAHFVFSVSSSVFFLSSSIFFLSCL